MLEQRPGAFEYALPVRQWRQKWTPEYEKMLDLLRQSKPDGSALLCPACRLAYPIVDEIPDLITEDAQPLTD